MDWIAVTDYITRIHNPNRSQDNDRCCQFQLWEVALLFNNSIQFKSDK